MADKQRSEVHEIRYQKYRQTSPRGETGSYGRFWSIAVQRELRSELIGHVIQSQPSSVEELIKAVRIAEASASAFEKVIMALLAHREVAERNTEELKRLPAFCIRRNANGAMAKIIETLP